MAPQKIYPPGVPNQEFAPLEVKNEKTGTVGKSRSLSGQILYFPCRHSRISLQLCTSSSFCVIFIIDDDIINILFWLLSQFPGLFVVINLRQIISTKKAVMETAGLAKTTGIPHDETSPLNSGQSYHHCPLCLHLFLMTTRAAKRCERCERCSCKDFPTGVKILVENVMKGGEKNFKCL